MGRHEILVTPTPTDDPATVDVTASAHSGEASGIFEIRIRGHGSWQQSVVEALRSAVQAGRIRIVSNNKPGARRKSTSDAPVLSGDFRAYLDAEDRWIPIY